jgi:hypothetical protein
MKYRSEWEWDLEMKRRGYTQGEDNRGIFYKDKIGFKHRFGGSGAGYSSGGSTGGVGTLDSPDGSNGYAKGKVNSRPLMNCGWGPTGETTPSGDKVYDYNCGTDYRSYGGAGTIGGYNPSGNGYSGGDQYTGYNQPTSGAASSPYSSGVTGTSPAPHDCNCHDNNSYNSGSNPVTNSRIATASIATMPVYKSPLFPSRFIPDIPATAGNDKFSKQAIINIAMANASVQAALYSGQKVILVRDNTIGGQRISNTQILGNSNASGSPLYVRFTGALNPDGSQPPGQSATFTFPDGSTLAPLSLGTQPQSSDCGCNHHTPHNTSGTPATNKPCIATSSTKAVTDTTQSIGTVSKDQNCPEPQPEDQGYFYVTDKEGTDTHHAARTFFNILNKGCGDLFDLNSRTGLVKLKPGKKPEDINKLVTSSIISPTLAKTVYDATQGGVDFNGSSQKQIVRMRVLRQNDDENDNYILHDFNSGFIDLDDFQDLLKQQMPADVRNDDDVVPIFTAATTLYGAITQAALIGHAIAERYLMKDYEQYIANRNKISIAEYEGSYRPWGDKRAGQILKEMVRTTDTGWDKNVSTCEYTKQESLGVRIQFYPNKASWALAILIYSSSNPKKWDEINSGYLQKKN